jgi:hypothetical protein
MIKRFIKLLSMKFQSRAMRGKSSNDKKDIVGKSKTNFYKCLACEYGVRISYHLATCIGGNRNPIRTKAYNGQRGDIIRPCNFKQSRWRKS